MRRIIYISLTVLLTAFSAVAQNPFKISRQSIERDGQNVKITFQVNASQSAVKHGEKILVTHSVTPIGQTSEGESITNRFYIAGNQQTKILHQKARLGKGNTSYPSVFISNGENYTFVESIPYDSSVKARSYELSFSAIKMGCCGVEEDFSEKYMFQVGPAMTPALSPVEHHRSKVKEAKDIYPFLRFTETDTDALRGVSVRFELAKSILDPEFSSNTQTLKSITEAITLLMNDEWSELQVINIAGFASPEGNTNQNKELSKRRAESLKSYIMNQFGFEENLFNITAGGEDWDGLYTLVDQSDMPYKAEVMEIIKNYPEEQRLARLKTLAGGRPYKSIQDVLFPQLRDACYINIWFSEKEDIVAKAINEAITMINDGKPEEALKVLLEYKNDPRSWNAIGSAKVLCEELKDALKWFEKAAKAGDTDAVANLAELEKLF